VGVLPLGAGSLEDLVDGPRAVELEKAVTGNPVFLPQDFATGPAPMYCF